MSETEQKHPKRRFRNLFRFSLLTLLILITVIAVVFGWWSHGARKQREAVAALREVGSEVEYDYEAEELDNPQYWPEWLVDMLGKDYFSNVEGLGIHNTQFTDAGLKHLEGLMALEWLWLTGTQVTDAGLKHLKGLTALERLWLADTQVTDKGLKHLYGLTALKELWLHHTGVTNEGVARLQKKLPNCQINR